MWWLPLSYVGGPPYQFFAQTGHPVAQKNEWRGKSGSGFWRFSYTNGRKQPKRTLLWRIISLQPFGLRSQVSPFWKEDMQGFIFQVLSFFFFRHSCWRMRSAFIRSSNSSLLTSFMLFSLRSFLFRFLSFSLKSSFCCSVRLSFHFNFLSYWVLALFFVWSASSGKSKFTPTSISFSLSESASKPDDDEGMYEAILISMTCKQLNLLFSSKLKDTWLSKVIQAHQMPHFIGNLYVLTSVTSGTFRMWHILNA